MQLQSQMKNSLQFRNQLLDGAVQCRSVYSIVIATQNVIFINDKLVDFWRCLVQFLHVLYTFIYVKCHFILTKSINEHPSICTERCKKTEKTNDEKSETEKSSCNVHQLSNACEQLCYITPAIVYGCKWNEINSFVLSSWFYTISHVYCVLYIDVVLQSFLEFEINIIALH